MKDDWIIHGNNKTDKDYRMILFHHAGGSAASFIKWKQCDVEAEICPVQLPMRENRINEPMPDNVQKIVKSFVQEAAELFENEYILFGHSMGGILAFETAKEIQRLGIKKPTAVFISSCNPPGVSDSHNFSDLSDEKLKMILKEYGLIPEEILNNPDYLEYYLPIARADFLLCEDYHLKSTDNTILDCPIVLLYGNNDNFLKYDELDKWKYYTSNAFSKYDFVGGHFYHFNNVDKVCCVIDNIFRFFSDLNNI